MVVDFLNNVESYPGDLTAHLTACYYTCSSLVEDIPYFQAMAAASTPNLQAAWCKKSETSKAVALLVELSTP